MTEKPDLLTKIKTIQIELSDHLLERVIIVQLAILALLTGQHLLLLGPPGTAKSLLVRSLSRHLVGATYFEHLLTRFSVPEELFGPLSLKALEQDRYERIQTGTLTAAHIAFLDEIFKANSAILNSLLALINERIYYEAGRVQSVPLLSLFAASNETPEEDGLGALYDRFLLRATIPYLCEDESLRKLFTLAPYAPTTTLNLDELRQAQDEVGRIPLGEDAVGTMIVIKHELEREGVVVSDRRWRACAGLVKAMAWLEGDPSASADHCDILSHALWSDLSEERVSLRVVSQVANPLNLEAIELEDAAKDLYDQRPAPDHQNITQALEPLLRQISDIHTRLEQRIANSPPRRTVRARQALVNIETWHRALSQLALRSLSQLHMAPGAA